MLTLYLRRNLSETAVPRNLVLRQWPDDGERTETTTGRIFWRYEDEADMVPQFLATGVPGFETAVPFDSRGRNIRLYFIGRTELDTPNAQSFAEAEQKVVDMSGTVNVESLFERFTDVTTTGTSEETLHIYQIDAGKLAVNGDKITAEYTGVFAANGDEKNVFVYLDGDQIFGAGPLLENGSHWTLSMTMMRASDAGLICKFDFASATSWEPICIEIPGLDLDANDHDLEFRAHDADNAGDTTLRMAYGEFKPASTTNTDWLLDEDGEPILDEDGDQIEEG